MTHQLARTRVAAALAVVLAVVLLTAGPASAHTTLRSSNPAAGSTVHTPPPQLEFVFSEDIDPAFVQLVLEDAAGPHEVDGVVGHGPSVTAPFPTGLRNGPVVARYRVVSADGHPVAGEVRFTLAAAGEDAVATESAPPGPSGGTAATPTTSGAPQGSRPTSTSGADISTGMMTALMVLATLVLVVVGVLLIRSDRRHRRP